MHPLPSDFPDWAEDARVITPWTGARVRVVDPASCGAGVYIGHQRVPGEGGERRHLIADPGGGHGCQYVEDVVVDVADPDTYMNGLRRLALDLGHSFAAVAEGVRFYRTPSATLRDMGWSGATVCWTVEAGTSATQVPGWRPDGTWAKGVEGRAAALARAWKERMGQARRLVVEEIVAEAEGAEAPRFTEPWR